MQKQSPSSATGIEHYEGTYRDVYGHEGKIRFLLQEGAKGLSGSCDLEVAHPDYSSTFRTAKGSEFTLQKEALKNGQAVNVQLQHVPKEILAEGETELVLDGQLTIQAMEAAPYAAKVIFGTANFSGDPGVGGGVWMAWLR